MCIQPFFLFTIETTGFGDAVRVVWESNCNNGDCRKQSGGSSEFSSGECHCNEADCIVLDNVKVLDK